MDEDTGEILVMRDPFRRCIVVHIKGTIPDAYRVVRLNRSEARRLAALILFQAERLGDARLAPVEESDEVGLKSA